MDANREMLQSQVQLQNLLLCIHRSVQTVTQPEEIADIMRFFLAEAPGMGINIQALAVHRVLSEAQRVETYRVDVHSIISVAELRDKTSGSELFRCWSSEVIQFRSVMPDTLEARDLSRKFGGLKIRNLVNIPCPAGVFSAHSIYPEAFSKAHVKILEQVADIFSVGLVRVRDLERMETQFLALQKKEAERRDAERLRVLTQLAAAAAHQINQPLSGISGRTEMLLYGKAEDDPDRAKLDHILDMVQDITEILEKMKNIQRYKTETYYGDIDMIDLEAAAN